MKSSFKILGVDHISFTYINAKNSKLYGISSHFEWGKTYLLNKIYNNPTTQEIYNKALNFSYYKYFYDWQNNKKNQLYKAHSFKDIVAFNYAHKDNIYSLALLNTSKEVGGLDISEIHSRIIERYYLPLYSKNFFLVKSNGER